jgi:hypothetical protein
VLRLAQSSRRDHQSQPVRSASNQACRAGWGNVFSDPAQIATINELLAVHAAGAAGTFAAASSPSAPCAGSRRQRFGSDPRLTGHAIGAIETPILTRTRHLRHRVSALGSAPLPAADKAVCEFQAPNNEHPTGLDQSAWRPGPVSVPAPPVGATFVPDQISTTRAIAMHNTSMLPTRPL